MQSLGQLKIKIYYWWEYDIEGRRRMEIAAEFFREEKCMSVFLLSKWLMEINYKIKQNIYIMEITFEVD